MTLEQFFDFGDILLAPNEAVALDGQVVGQRIDRAQGRKLVGQAGDVELPHALGFGEIA